MNTQIETDIDVAKQLFKARMIIKQLSQLSFEAREIDKAFPADYYDFNSAEKMFSFYAEILHKIVKLSNEIDSSDLI